MKTYSKSNDMFHNVMQKYVKGTIPCARGMSQMLPHTPSTDIRPNYMTKLLFSVNKLSTCQRSFSITKFIYEVLAKKRRK
jgi:hypothetical protein